MNLRINGQEVSGKTADLVELLRQMKRQTIPVQTALVKADIEDTITQSQKLRETLSQDPEFNPYGGVVPGNESDMSNTLATPRREYAAELETGVSQEY